MSDQVKNQHLTNGVVDKGLSTSLSDADLRHLNAAVHIKVSAEEQALKASRRTPPPPANTPRTTPIQSPTRP